MPPPVAPGQVIKGKYRVDRILGEGGMGVVVAGHHVGLNQRCAIKFLHTAMLAHPEVVERFAREARAASRLESDHVARVTDVDALDDGTPFMVMEYLEGTDLATVRASGQPLPLHVAAGYIIEACEAFAEAHAHGIVHRDIKPANLFLAKRAGGKTRVKVLDFGISKMGAGDGEAGVTRTSSVMGSAHYMSPEQMLTPREVDLRTDIWALGITLFELTTAQLPFPGESVTQVCAMVMSMSPPAPSSVRPDLPRAFDEIVKRCLGRHPSERFASVEQLVAALEPLARLGPPSTSAPTIATAPEAETWRLSPEAAAAARASVLNPGSDPRLAALDSSPRASVPGSNPQIGAPGSNPPMGGSNSRAGVPGSDPRLGLAGPSAMPAVVPTSLFPSHAPPTHGTPPGVSLTGLPAGVPKRSMAIWIATAVGAVAIGAIAAVGLGMRGGPAATAVSSAAPVESAPAVTTSVHAAPTPSVESPRVVPAVEAPSSKSPSASAPPAKSSAAAPRPALPPVAPTPPPAKKAAPSCNPPFTIDEQGVKRAKPECL